MIKLYEVKFRLANGQTLSVLMAAGSDQEAKSAAHSTLQQVSSPAGPSIIKANWRWDEVTASEVQISTIA